MRCAFVNQPVEDTIGQRRIVDLPVQSDGQKLGRQYR